MSAVPCYRIPPGVEFQRWHGGEDWVLYHSGTGETLRLSEAALAVLVLLLDAGPMPAASLAAGLNQQLDAPLADGAMQSALAEILRVLERHECVEAVEAQACS